MFCKTTLFTRIFIALAALMLLSACTVPSNAPDPAVNSVLGEVAPTTAAAVTPAPSRGELTVDASGVAQSVAAQIVAAVPASADSPWWMASAQHTELSLQGYPIANHALKPQLFIYPVKDLEINEVAAQQAANLKVLLKDRLPAENLPFMPLQASAKQMAQAQVKYLDFKSGKGVRYLTQYANGLVPFNNQDLVYTFQGLTADGLYYVSAVLPVNLSGLAPTSLISAEEARQMSVPFPVLPSDTNLTDQQIQDFGAQYRDYISASVTLFDQQPAGAFTPDLSMLDALIQSIEIQ